MEKKIWLKCARK